MTRPLATPAEVCGAVKADLCRNKSIYIDSTCIEVDFIVSTDGNNNIR
jgi:hypothetical protein